MRIRWLAHGKQEETSRVKNIFDKRKRKAVPRKKKGRNFKKEIYQRLY